MAAKPLNFKVHFKSKLDLKGKSLCIACRYVGLNGQQGIFALLLNCRSTLLLLVQFELKDERIKMKLKSSQSRPAYCQKGLLSFQVFVLLYVLHAKKLIFFIFPCFCL